jgi:LAO/AO transport system kinase
MPTIAELVHTACAPGPAAMRAAARLMSLLADAPHRLPEVFHAAAQVFPDEADRLLLPRMLVGITGAPGSGKSTLTDALIRAYRQRHRGCRLGVVAVDPSSPFTGGAVLGDRVRMMRHATDPLVFVRSMASRGHLGGLALGVKGVIRVMGLIGCEVVFIETVGVGQSEVEVAGVADLVMIVLAPGQGDSIQLLKAGLMEIGDLFVVNKADRPDSARLHADLLSMLRVAQEDPSGHHAGAPADADADQELVAPLITRRPGAEIEPQTYLVSGEQGQGIEDLVSGLDRLASTHGTGWQQHRRQMIVEEVREAVLEEAARRVRHTLRGMGEGQEPVSAVLGGSLSVGDAAARLLAETCRQKGQA